MIYNNQEAKAQFPQVRFYGYSFFIGVGTVIGEGAVIRADADIRKGVVIGEYVDIGARAVIGECAVIREGAVINSVCSTFNGNIIPMKDTVLIRIGCEIHTMEEWDEHGAAYARKACESEWWENSGKYMYGYLKGEAERYQEKYMT